MAEILLKDLTVKELDGTGVFDELMTSVQVNLEEEYTKSRIKGSDYTKVYLGGLESVLTQSIVFLLGRQQADKQAELLQRQIDKMDIEIINEGIQTELLEKEKGKLDAEIALLIEQLVYLKNQSIKLAQDGALVDQNTANALTTNGVILAQIDKVLAEVALLEQKVFTEQAQIRDIVDNELVVGVIGKENALRAQQTEGFKRDSEQKLLKIMTDTWITRQTTDGALADPAGLADSDIDSVIQKARDGIGA